MRRFLCSSGARVALLILLIVSFSSPAAAEECGWLPAEALDRAFPDGAPWRTLVGGKVGSCKFRSDPRRPPNMVGANQMVKESAAEASTFVEELRGSMAESYDVEPAPAIGEKGFVYRPRGTEGERALFFVGHRGRVVVIGSMTFQQAITAEQRESVEKLLLAALALDEDEAGIEAATTCPWFDRSLVRKLLPEDGYTEQVFGSSSCLANVGEKVVMLSIFESESAASVAERMTGMGDCRTDTLEIGEAGWLNYACISGNPRATVRWISGGRVGFELSFIPGREPTEAERALLLDLARAAAAR